MTLRGDRPVWRVVWRLAIAILVGHGTAVAEVRQLGPHIHGVSTLDVVVEGNTVSMDLQSPGADIVGFESQPVSDEQKTAVGRANQMLSRPLDLFQFPAAAQCTVASAAATEVFLRDNGTTPAGPPPPDSTPFDRYIQQAQHAEFAAAYTLRCDKPAAITTIDMATRRSKGSAAW